MAGATNAASCLGRFHEGRARFYRVKANRVTHSAARFVIPSAKRLITAVIN